jgi:hypothetical protein
VTRAIPGSYNSISHNPRNHPSQKMRHQTVPDRRHRNIKNIAEVDFRSDEEFIPTDRERSRDENNIEDPRQRNDLHQTPNTKSKNIPVQYRDPEYSER